MLPSWARLTNIRQGMKALPDTNKASLATKKKKFYKIVGLGGFVFVPARDILLPLCFRPRSKCYRRAEMSQEGGVALLAEIEVDRFEF